MNGCENLDRNSLSKNLVESTTLEEEQVENTNSEGSFPPE